MKLPKNEEDEMSSIAVLIPCYNESVTIKKVIEDYKKALPEATIYVYDNNSSDGTDEIARKAGAEEMIHIRQKTLGIWWILY